jgi:hypothetical protein
MLGSLTLTPVLRVPRRPIVPGGLMLVFSLVAACGGSPATPTPVPTIAGAWQGQIESGQDGPGTISLQFTQSGLQVTGAVELSQNGLTSTQGTFTGTLDSSSLPTTMTYVVIYAFGPFECRGTFSGTMTVTAAALDGTFAGQNCVQPFTGSLHATKTGKEGAPG